MSKEESKPFRFAELHAMAAALRGVALKIFEQLRFTTKGGQRWVTMSGAEMAHHTAYSERQVWRGLSALLNKGLIQKRTRHGFKRVIGHRGRRIWSKLSNEYRLIHRKHEIAKTSPGRLWKPDTRHCDIGVRSKLIIDINKPGAGSIWNGPAPREEVLAQFYARVGMNKITEPC